ncbi:MAG: hypothetical protein HY241_17180 [Actinobacteria bacterium]|nr:hypothetical protein [Actinomycetota bacterium]
MPSGFAHVVDLSARADRTSTLVFRNRAVATADGRSGAVNGPDAALAEARTGLPAVGAAIAGATGNNEATTAKTVIAVDRPRQDRTTFNADRLGLFWAWARNSDIGPTSVRIGQTTQRKPIATLCARSNFRRIG